jgi:hypothetical protein
MECAKEESLIIPGTKRVDCTVEVKCLNALGNQFSQSYFDWNVPGGQRVLMQRMLSILRDHGGEMHYFDFMKEYKRRYPNG